jgi:hypothetical protein
VRWGRVFGKECAVQRHACVVAGGAPLSALLIFEDSGARNIGAPLLSEIAMAHL